MDRNCSSWELKLRQNACRSGVRKQEHLHGVFRTCKTLWTHFLVDVHCFGEGSCGATEVDHYQEPGAFFGNNQPSILKDRLLNMHTSVIENSTKIFYKGIWKGLSGSTKHHKPITTRTKNQPSSSNKEQTRYHPSTSGNFSLSKLLNFPVARSPEKTTPAPVGGGTRRRASRANAPACRPGPVTAR